MSAATPPSPPFLFDLGLAPVLTLQGPDARRFANGMFTQNVRDLAVGAAARSAMTDDRGRILGLLDLYCTDQEGFLLVLEGVDGDWFQERYGMYIVFDDVEMADLSGELVLLSVQGQGAGQVVQQALGGADPALGHRLVDGVHLLARDRAATGGWDLLVPHERADALRADLAVAGAQPAALDELLALRVRAGLPTWPADRSGERTFVHELGLRDLVCSFDKGCYVGQEVINRMDTMGRPTRRLLGLTIQGAELPPEGTTVQLDGATIGRMGTAARVGDQLQALAVLQKKGWAPGTSVTLTTANASWPAIVSTLPFD